MAGKYLTLLALLLCVAVLNGCGGGGGSNDNGDNGGDTDRGITTLLLDADDMVYDQFNQRIYASVKNTGGPHSNMVVAIDPARGLVTDEVFVGSNPTKLALSADGQYLYVAIDAAVQRIDTSDMSCGLQISLGNDYWCGPRYADDIEVAPNDPNVIAVSLMCEGYTPRHNGVAIFDNGEQRPDTLSEYSEGNVIEFSPDSTSLYAFCNECTGFEFTRIRVTDTGVSEIDVTGNLINGFDVDIEYAGGRIYATSGDVIDPVALQYVGRFPIAGLVAPDLAAEKVYFLIYSRQTDNCDVSEFSSVNYTQTGTFAIPKANGDPTCFLRFGTNGIAFGTDAGKVYILSTTMLH